MSLEEVREYFENLLQEAEDEIRKQRRNKKVLGPVRVCRTDPFSCPKTPAPMGTLSPRFASKNGEFLTRAQHPGQLPAPACKMDGRKAGHLPMRYRPASTTGSDSLQAS